MPGIHELSRLGRFVALLHLLVATRLFAADAANQPIIWAGAPCELSLSQVSEKTVQIELAPLDDQGQPRPTPATAAFINFPTTGKLKTRSLTGVSEVKVGNLTVNITAPPLTISVHRADGKLVQELVLADATNNTVSFHIDAPVFGLGEGEQQFDRRGSFYGMTNGQRTPMLATHGATIPVPFLIGADGWSMFIRGPWGFFDLRGGQGLFLPRARSVGREPLIVYITDAREPADALTEFYRLTGSPIMPPKWVLGYMQSHRTLLGPEDALRVAQTFREKKLPVDAVIYLGTGYCTNGWNTGHGSLTFNPNAFPHPAEQIKALHDLNLKVVLHINNAPRNLFGASVAEKSDDPLHISNYWARHLDDMALGVDAWWPDDGDELPIEARLARHRLYFEGPVEVRPNVRPWDLQRNAYPGAARFGGWIWSGDTESRWATLKSHVPVGLNTSLSLTPFWGTDIGGFVPTRELTGELYVRWFQFGAFNPLFRSHGRTWHLRLPWGWNLGETGPLETRDVTDPAELHNAQVEPICRDFLNLRYQLLPYNYSLMRETCETGLPAMRALWLQYPNDPEAVRQGEEYLWGRDLLVAPVVEKGATNRSVYLPAGAWYDWWTQAKLTGGRSVDKPVDLSIMPIYVRAGAIIPLDPVRQYTAETVAGPTVLRVFPGADGDFTFYDDDGQSLAYQNPSDPSAIWIRFHWDDKTRTLTAEPDPRMKQWPGGTRAYAIEVLGQSDSIPGKPNVFQFNGQRVKIKL